MQNTWARLLAYITGLVNQRLLLQCEYLAAENRILRSHLPSWLRLSDSQRGESSLRKALDQYLAHYHAERTHRGTGNLLLFPSPVAKATPTRPRLSRPPRGPATVLLSCGVIF